MLADMLHNGGLTCCINSRIVFSLFRKGRFLGSRSLEIAVSQTARVMV